MTAAEVAVRLARAAQARGERLGLLGWRTLRAPPADLAVTGNAWIGADARVAPEPYVRAADRIAEGWLDVFALRGLDLGTPPRWNRDPKSGIEAPLVFGKAIDYRDPALVGDIKYLWEPNRHLHLVTLAQAYRLTGKRRYADALREQLESWFLACPYPLGPNWTSALEHGVRLVNWAIAWQLAGGLASPLFEGEDGEGFRDRWLRSVYQHARFIRGWFSHHSSANNHLIGEAAGLFVAAVTWPHWREARGWAARAQAILEREALAQNAPDGVNREQAVSYQQFVLDMLLVAMLAGKANGRWFSAAFESRVEAMLDFLASIMDCRGNVPMIGDADDGYLVRLAVQEDFSPYKSLLATGAILFKRGDFKHKARSLDDKTRWLLGAAADAQFARIDSERTRVPPRQQFGEGGYYVLGAEFETPSEIRIVVDAGPLGYRPIAAHGHADALSFTLSVDGRELFVDPGTYAYHTQARWRAYFRGTAAHNTVRVDGEDQSEPGGNFLWLRKARAGCSLWLSSAQKDTFEGWHDGYLRLPDPVKHRRLLELDKAARILVVEDTLEMSEAHDVELLFHCSEDCTVVAVPGGFRVSQGEASVRVLLPRLDPSRIESGGEEARACVHHGSVSPIFGWVSRRFDHRVPASTIVWRARLPGRACLRTELQILSG